MKQTPHNQKFLEILIVKLQKMEKQFQQIFKHKVCGTHGKKWYTDVENNIAFSFFVKTNCNIKKIDGITVEIAETIIEIFKNIYNIELEIKYPNDIIYNDKKIGGILTNTKLNGEQVKYIVIGIRTKYKSMLF